jgi:SAM-dependent MidA family methyltransferase
VTTQALAARITERIRREGPITFADYMALALDDPADGFFASGGAGRAGRDFVTSPEVGTLFGNLVARALDRTWEHLGAPDPFVVIEAGAGRGRLAADILRAAPVCAPALRYVLVESSPALRAEQRELLTLEPADEALGPSAHGADPDEAPELVTGTGPIVASLDDLPGVHVDGVIIANELLDNLPVRVVERTADGWAEARVGLGPAGAAFVESIVPASVELTAEADAVAAGTEVGVGVRLPVPLVLRDWLARAASILHRGEVVVIDYADDVAGLIARGSNAGPSGWLRTYRAHGRGTDPLETPGAQDITYDVPLEYLRAVAARAGFAVTGETSQAEWLRTLGVDGLADEGAAIWRERAAIGDLEAVAGRSRVTEAAALTAPAGLGAHRVLTLERRVR